MTKKLSEKETVDLVDKADAYLRSISLNRYIGDSWQNMADLVNYLDESGFSLQINPLDEGKIEIEDFKRLFEDVSTQFGYVLAKEKIDYGVVDFLIEISRRNLLKELESRFYKISNYNLFDFLYMVVITREDILLGDMTTLNLIITIQKAIRAKKVLWHNLNENDNQELSYLM
ncbi:hypothetical protein [Liquorilactobacillus uvarum]|uniref:Uncharacterized protein n=1 Tax=Liquorilactobacillus uvarum DSM 19971 TaxID=1423812 RepID=A0A0R1PU14_9LACO|nr:hypothetical protein [Liquorilactobacillus uvarum]KRL33205.1 hypothetical protein FD20_GL002013 [Liquorilactobacillus uvarum DSM 19971]